MPKPQWVTYTVTILTQDGTPPYGAYIYIYTDSSRTELMEVCTLDANGRLTFTALEGGAYVAVIGSLPDSYLLEEYYPLDSTNVRITLELAPVIEDVPPVNKPLRVGDTMPDFSITAADGTVYTLSEMLQEKKAVVLNFWYLNCGPCKIEFPYMQQAYEQYSEDIEILALDTYGDSDREIANFRTQNGYTFPMLAADPAWEQAIKLEGYPTTVIIDRYGVICLIELGYQPSVDHFLAAFEYFTADDYVSKPIRDMESLLRSKEN